MLHTRDEIKEYALSVCVPMLEKAAERRLSQRSCEVVDTIGYVPSQLEEMFRPFWGITPILREEEIFLHIRGERVPIGEWLREVLLSGTDPNSPYYWDVNREYTDKNNFPGSFHFQNITEIAGLLIGCFFARAQTWDYMSESEQKQVADYIAQGSQLLCCHIAGNNHIWFPLFCLLVLRKFGFDYPDTDRYLREGLARLDTMYIGDGWYSDGAFGRIDYYEAWSMHAYPLLWCLIEDESWQDYGAFREKYVTRTARFLQDYAKFFDIDGAHPPFGRSLSYRFAASCVFPLAILAGVEFDPALAGEITRRNISYFAENVRTGEDHILPPGYLYNAPGLIDNYTSSGGPYWAAKTFLCLLLPASHPFWQSAVLPIEDAPYIEKPSDPRLNFAFAGDKKSGVTVYNSHFQYYQNGRYCNPFNDMASYYNKFCYNSRAGFAISTRDNTAGDNMICLSTADASMTSHRFGFTDLGCEGHAMVSEHMPFSNDSGTKIKTWLIPLEGSMHVRIHCVTLSQPYIVSEGGFSLGLWDDYRDFGEENGVFSVRNRENVSYLHTAASVPITYAAKRPQPGLHMLAPYAVYPVYQTNLLEEGEYLFASVLGIQSAAERIVAPEIRLEKGRVSILDRASGETCFVLCL